MQSGNDGQPPDRPDGPVVAVFRSGRTAPAERGPVRPSMGPAEPRPAEPVTPPSEPPAQAVVVDALSHDLHHKLRAVEELHGVLTSATLYRLLSVSTSAAPAQIREAYFTAVRCFHPYTFVLAAADERRVKVSAVFEALTRAYETLRRPSTRARYDDELGLAPAFRFGGTPPVDPDFVVPAAPASPDPRATQPSSSVAPPALEAAPLRDAPAPSMRPPAPRPTMSVRPPAPRTSVRPGAVPQRSMRPSSAPRAMMLESHAVAPPRERASAAVRGERDLVLDDDPPPARAGASTAPRAPFGAEPGTGGARNPFDGEGTLEEEVRRSSTLLREFDRMAQERLREEEPEPAGDCPGLLDIANQVRGGGAMSNWAAGRLREAHEAELAGRIADAATLVRSVQGQLRDPHIKAHVQRLSRLALDKA